MMACPNATTTIMRSVSSEKTEYIADSSTANTLRIQLNNQPSRGLSDGHVAILWDIENCPVPNGVRPEDVGGNIRMALRVHPVIRGAVRMFNAYGDFTFFSRRVREGCQRTGVKLIDVPNGRKDAADKAILVDMFLFALDNPPPSSIMLISGDVDFAPALHILGQRGYTVILVIPQGVGVSSALCNAGKFVWDWPSVAHGEGFVPPARAPMPPRVGPSEGPGYFMGCRVNENFQNEEEHVIYKGISQSYYHSRDLSVIPYSVSGYNSSSLMPCYPATRPHSSLPLDMNEVSTGPVTCNQSDSALWVHPGDLSGLKWQFVKLLEVSGGSLYLNRVPTEYQKLYGRPLFVSDYGAVKLVNLFQKMGDAMTMVGKGHKRFVYLLHGKMSTAAPPPMILARKDDGKGKSTHEECLNVVLGNVSSDELSDEDRVVANDELERRRRRSQGMMMAQCGGADDKMFEQFKYELQEILVSYSCRIFLGSFAEIYQQRYKKPLDHRRFGVVEVEDLFEKFGDVVAIHEEPGSEKFLTPIGG